MVTANNRIAPEDYPHHITSDYLDGYRARRIEQLIAAEPTSTTSTSFAGDADRHALASRARDRPPAGAAAPARPARDGGDRAAAQLGRADGPGLGRGDDLPGVHAAARRARSPARRSATATWPSAGSTAPTTASSPTSPRPGAGSRTCSRLWEEGDEELIGRPWDELALDALRGALDDLDDRFGADPAGWRWGEVHALDFPHALGEANPLLGWIFNRTARGRRRPGDRRPGRLGPERPVHRDLGARAGGWSPTRCDPERSRWQALHRPVGPRRRAPTTTTSSRAGSPGETQPMAGEGPWQRADARARAAR